jgi:hypothetical protein
VRENYQYMADERIKQIVIGIQELRCRRRIADYPRFQESPASKIDWLEQTKLSAKHELLDMIGDFILVKELEDRPYTEIEATLYLPYVRDSKIEELENDGDFWRKSAMRSEGEITELCKKIRLLERPWWKKLLRIEK